MWEKEPDSSGCQLHPQASSQQWPKEGCARDGDIPPDQMLTLGSDEVSGWKISLGSRTVGGLWGGKVVQAEAVAPDEAESSEASSSFRS